MKSAPVTPWLRKATAGFTIQKRDVTVPEGSPTHVLWHRRARPCHYCKLFPRIPTNSSLRNQHFQFQRQIVQLNLFDNFKTPSSLIVNFSKAFTRGENTRQVAVATLIWRCWLNSPVFRMNEDMPWCHSNLQKIPEVELLESLFVSRDTRWHLWRFKVATRHFISLKYFIFQR